MAWLELIEGGHTGGRGHRPYIGITHYILPLLIPAIPSQQTVENRGLVVGRINEMTGPGIHPFSKTYSFTILVGLWSNYFIRIASLSATRHSWFFYRSVSPWSIVTRINLLVYFFNREHRESTCRYCIYALLHNTGLQEPDEINKVSTSRVLQALDWLARYTCLTTGMYMQVFNQDPNINTPFKGSPWIYWEYIIISCSSWSGLTSEGKHCSSLSIELGCAAVITRNNRGICTRGQLI